MRCASRSRVATRAALRVLRCRRRCVAACVRSRAPPRAQTVRDKCFQKCITRPGSSMSNSEVQCLANCCDRYIDVRALRRRGPCRSLARRLTPLARPQATKVVVGTVAAVNKAASQEQGFGGGLH